MKDEYLQFIETVMEKDISFYTFEILYCTGIRLGELIALTKSDFDFRKRRCESENQHRELTENKLLLIRKHRKGKKFCLRIF